MSIDIKNIRQDFPILSTLVNGNNLVYLDNAATTQKPKVVIDTITELYSKYNSNIHRGIHYLSSYCTTQTENAREIIRKFINADSLEEIIFTKGTTEAINLVASSFGDAFVSEGDEIIVSEMEHHSNIVPWQLLCERKKAKLIVLPFNDDGVLEVEKLDSLISKNTKLIAVAHISNALGSVNPIKEIINIAHLRNVPVLIDAAQSVQHLKIDVIDLDCDFFVFSGHKLYGPTGIGVLYGKKDLLNAMPPYQGGGEMISRVSFEKTSFNVLPFKFEAGTPNYIGAIALAKAIEYIQQIGLENIEKHESILLKYASERFEALEWLKIIGRSPNKSSLISFVAYKAHPSDIGVLLDQMGIAIRTGTHCAEPVMQHFNIPGTARASFALYNTLEEIDVLFNGLNRIEKLLK